MFRRGKLIIIIIHRWASCRVGGDHALPRPPARDCRAGRLPRAARPRRVRAAGGRRGRAALSQAAGRGNPILSPLYNLLSLCARVNPPSHPLEL